MAEHICARHLPALFCLLLLAACASHDNPRALLDESVAWYTGTTGQIDDPRARRLLERAAATGDPLAVMWMARVYSTGRMTFPRDEETARRIAATVIGTIETQAMAGDPEAQFLIGTAYAEGLGKEVDHATAASWYAAAADRGHMLARHNLGNAYAAGRGIDQDDALAVQWWRLAAEEGDAIPQFMLGSMYEQGRGIAMDPAAARYWYSEAAARGLARAGDALQRLSP